jgi:hypothetical protein
VPAVVLIVVVVVVVVGQQQDGGSIGRSQDQKGEGYHQKDDSQEQRRNDLPGGHPFAAPL